MEETLKLYSRGFFYESNKTLFCHFPEETSALVRIVQTVITAIPKQFHFLDFYVNFPQIHAAAGEMNIMYGKLHNTFS